MTTVSYYRNESIIPLLGPGLTGDGSRLSIDQDAIRDIVLNELYADDQSKIGREIKNISQRIVQAFPIGSIVEYSGGLFSVDKWYSAENYYDISNRNNSHYVSPYSLSPVPQSKITNIIDSFQHRVGDYIYSDGMVGRIKILDPLISAYILDDGSIIPAHGIIYKVQDQRVEIGYTCLFYRDPFDNPIECVIIDVGSDYDTGTIIGEASDGNHRAGRWYQFYIISTAIKPKEDVLFGKSSAITSTPAPSSMDTIKSLANKLKKNKKKVKQVVEQPQSTNKVILEDFII